MENQINPVPAQQSAVVLPSLYYLQCPHCGGGGNFQVLGKKGALGKSIGVGLAFGAVGNLVANSMTQDDYTFEPTQYRCGACGKKFESPPLVARPEELLSAPCKIVFTRKSGFYGMAVAQSVWLNGVKIGPVKNGQTIEFLTYTRYNTLFVTDQFGVAFKGDYKFEAQPGGQVVAQFKRKFVQ
ncbi:MAG: hypothetical protein LBJ11_04820 [Oscillospiraceae bacterium]|nr:hypothetical protein [Oscillospiraceae bacterium]